MCSPQHGSKDAHDLLSAHTRVRCASDEAIKRYHSDMLSTHTRVRCASEVDQSVTVTINALNSYPRAVCISEGKGSIQVRVLSTHTRVRCASSRLTVDEWAMLLSTHTRVRCASAVRQGLQGGCLLSTHTRVRCASSSRHGRTIPPAALNSYPRAVCISRIRMQFATPAALNSYPRAVCIGKSH